MEVIGTSPRQYFEDINVLCTTGAQLRTAPERQPDHGDYPRNWEPRNLQLKSAASDACLPADEVNGQHLTIALWMHGPRN